MNKYFKSWVLDHVRIARPSGDVESVDAASLIPAGVCPLAFAACYPYVWTLQRGGWFRWVPRREQLIKWFPRNRNLSHPREVLVACPNAKGQVVFGVARDAAGVHLRVRSVRQPAACLQKHEPGQSFVVPLSVESDPRIFYQMFPYFLSAATRKEQEKPLDQGTAVGCHCGRVELGAPSATGSICANGLAYEKSRHEIRISEMRMPCRYQRKPRSYRSDQAQPMGRMCPDAAWAGYPDGLAALYDGEPKDHSHFRFSCPASPGGVRWRVRVEWHSGRLRRALRNAIFRVFGLIGIHIDRPDRDIFFEVEDVSGRCEAGYRPGDSFRMNIVDRDRLCPAAFSSLYPLSLLWLRQTRSSWPSEEGGCEVSCPDVHGSNYRLLPDENRD